MELPDPALYPHYFQVSPTETNFNTLRMAILRHFNWRRVYVIHHVSKYHALAAEYMIGLLSKSDVTVAMEISFLNFAERAIDKLEVCNDFYF